MNKHVTASNASQASTGNWNQAGAGAGADKDKDAHKSLRIREHVGGSVWVCESCVMFRGDYDSIAATLYTLYLFYVVVIFYY